MPWISGNYWLQQAAMENNALIIANYGYAHGWTRNAIAAILGNMQAESHINPGIWENLTPYGGGYGLVQWTPYTKYSQWATNNGYEWQDNGDAELARISYEAANGIQWFYNSEIGMAPPITFQQFLSSTLSVDTLSNYWLWFYEHPRDPYAGTQAYRQGLSRSWYNFIPASGTIPIWLLFKFKDGR